MDETIEIERITRMPVPHIPTIIVERNCMFRLGVTHALFHTRFVIYGEYSFIDEVNTEEIPPGKCIILIGIDDITRKYQDMLLEMKKNNNLLYVVLLGDKIERDEIQDVAEFGAQCFLNRYDLTPEILLKSLEFLLTGQVVLTGEFIHALRERWPPRVGLAESPTQRVTTPSSHWEVHRLLSDSDGQWACHLSDRETAILMRIMHGASNKVIARELDIAEATVKVHVKSVLRKIRVKNRTQAATWALTRCSRPAATEQPDRREGVALLDIDPQPGQPANGALEDEPV